MAPPSRRTDDRRPAGQRHDEGPRPSGRGPSSSCSRGQPPMTRP
ncbi:hypothetical protein [Ornithinimicrobium kibberense]